MPRTAPRLDLSDLSISKPKQGHKTVKLHFRTSATGDMKGPIHPASGLQTSFKAGEGEVFSPDRLTLRDISVGADGLCTVEARVPYFNVGDYRMGEPGPAPPDTTVRIHAWHGERFIGTWEAGRIRGNLITDADGMKPYDIVA